MEIVKTELPYISELSELTVDQFNYIVNHIKYEKAKELVYKELNKSNVDFRELLNRYLDELKLGTRKTYEKFLVDFISNEKNLFDWSRSDADIYIKKLSQSYSTASVRLFISALSSFTNKLIRWDALKENVWSGAKLPDQETEDLRVPDDKDVEILLNHYKNVALSKSLVYKEKKNIDSAKKMYIALMIMVHNGLRVGAIKDLQISGDRYTTHSKGKKISGILKKEVLGAFDELQETYSLLKQINKPMVQFNLSTICNRMKNDGRIKEVYHPHSFRHYYAIKKYEETKDIYEVSRALNHAGVQVTQRYLESMDLL